MFVGTTTLVSRVVRLVASVVTVDLSELVRMLDDFDRIGARLVGPSFVEQVTKVVGQFELDFLPVVALVDRRVLVQRVSRQLVELAEGVLALDEPLHFEVRLEVERLHGLVVAQTLADESRSLILLVLWVRSRLHSCDALEVRTFIDAEDQDHVVASGQGLLQFPRRL